MKKTEKTMEKIVALCKGRGFIFAGSEIYGGLANTWDYGPLGVELKNNVKRAWWKKFVQENPYNVGLDAAILMNPQVWVASGHVGGFSDPLMDCKECKERFRADKIIEEWAEENSFALPKPVDAFSQEEMKDFIEEHNIPCPSCGKHNFTDIRQFNLMSPFPFRKKMHTVFLRNVMIYFDDKTKQQLVQKVYDVMKPGGYLFIGTTETIDRSVTPFEIVQPSIFRKKEG